jgi:hypothetical protein
MCLADDIDDEAIEFDLFSIAGFAIARLERCV